MPTPNPSTRREYRGAAAPTTLANSMSSTDTSFILAATNNWPTGAVGNFIVTIDRGNANEERILCASQAAKVVTVAGAGRGFDGTAATSHAAGANVECTLSGFDADEWNAHTSAVSGVHGVAGSVVGTSDAQTLTNKTLNGATLDATSTLGGVSGTTLSAVSAAWTNYTPTTFTGITSPAGTFRYRLVGKTLDLWFYLTAGTFTASSPTFTLPAGLVGVNVAGTTQSFPLSQFGLYQPGRAYVQPNVGTVTMTASGVIANGNPANGFGGTGVIELQ